MIKAWQNYTLVGTEIAAALIDICYLSLKTSSSLVHSCSFLEQSKGKQERKRYATSLPHIYLDATFLLKIESLVGNKGSLAERRDVPTTRTLKQSIQNFINFFNC